ncbi:MAG: gamma-glutamylcyclotransferase, partial [Pseudomonadota bacterium]
KGARGSEDAPGLFAALSRGDGCEGVAFRIAEADVDHETDILFRREMVGPGYLARRLALTVGDAPAMALTFLADPECEDVVPDLARADQVDYLACGTGFLGSSYDYLANLVSHLAELGIDDRHCTALLAEVDQHRAALEKHRP